MPKVYEVNKKKYIKKNLLFLFLFLFQFSIQGGGKKSKLKNTRWAVNKKNTKKKISVIFIFISILYNGIQGGPKVIQC